MEMKKFQGVKEGSKRFDYCIPKERFIKNVCSRKKNPKLGLCEGDCDSDRDCQDGLKCQQRSGSAKVRCVGNPEEIGIIVFLKI